MKRLFTGIKKKSVVTALFIIGALTLTGIIIGRKAGCLAPGIRAALGNTRGEGFVDTAIKILMAVVIGALLLAGLYALFGETVLPTLVKRVTDMFNYTG